MTAVRNDLGAYLAHQARLGEACRCHRRPGRYALATSTDGYHSPAVYLSAYRHPLLRSPAGPDVCPPRCGYCYDQTGAA